MVFFITKILQILKRFSRALSWAQTFYFWRVSMYFHFFPEKSSNIRRQQKLPPVAVIYKPKTESAVKFKTTNKTQNSTASSYCWESTFTHQKRLVEYFLNISLFWNKRFMLDEITQRNASKFAIFYIYVGKKLWVFVYIKYGNFWSVLSGHFIKHKPFISEE